MFNVACVSPMGRLTGRPGSAIPVAVDHSTTRPSGNKEMNRLGGHGRKMHSIR